MADDWEKVEMSPTWDYEKQKEIVGAYISKEQKVGPNESNLYNVQMTDGSTVGVWGNAMLDDRFKNISVGEEVKIVYLGKVKSDKTGRQYNSFDVFHRKTE